MWTQLKTPTKNVKYTGGWCLSAVQDSFGTDHPYPTAIGQWNGAGNKYGGRPPSGISVPVFFSFTTEPAGHVAVQFADGTVGSSTQSGTHNSLYIHPNSEDLMKVYRDAGWKMTYLGWKDTVGTQQVVKYIEPKPVEKKLMVDQQLAEVYYRFYIGSDASDYAHKFVIGKMTPAQLQNHLMNSEVFKEKIEKAKTGELKLNELLLHTPSFIRSNYKEPVTKGFKPVEETLYIKE